MFGKTHVAFNEPLFQTISADAYIIQIQKYEVAPPVATPVTPVTTTNNKPNNNNNNIITPTAISVMNAAQLRFTKPAQGGMPGISVPTTMNNTSLAFPKVLGLNTSTVRPTLKMSITQASSIAKATVSERDKFCCPFIAIHEAGDGFVFGYMVLPYS